MAIADYEEFIEAVGNGNFGYFEMEYEEFEVANCEVFGGPYGAFMDEDPYDYLVHVFAWRLPHLDRSRFVMMKYIDMDEFINENYFLIQFIRDGGYIEGRPVYYRENDRHFDPLNIQNYVLGGKSLPKYLLKILN